MVEYICIYVHICVYSVTGNQRENNIDDEVGTGII